MPTRASERGSSGTTLPVRVSCSRISRTRGPYFASWEKRRFGHPSSFGRKLRKTGTPSPVNGRSEARKTADEADRVASAVTGQTLRGQRLRAVERAFRTLPDRYLGAEPGFDATYHVRLGDVGHTWEIRCTTHGARVRKGGSSRKPDVTIGTDADTWMRLRAGELSGIEAFSQRKLYARGNLDLAIGFEGLFRLPNGRPPLLRIHDVRVGRTKVSTLTMGRGKTDVLLLHGLGATKHSFIDTSAALSDHYRIHAIDLP